MIRFDRNSLGALALALGLATGVLPGQSLAKSFVSEATHVIDQVTDQGEQANNAIETFYQDFSRAAERMVELEARVEQWKQEGYLCEQYSECPEKYDLIYAYHGQAMGEIQQAYEAHQDQILASLANFNRMVYQGKDELADLQSDELSSAPVEISRLRSEQEGLKSRRSDLERECPDKTSRACLRKWRAYQRSLNQTHRKIQRLAYARKLAALRQSILTRLDGVLDGYGDLEADAVVTLADYAFLFEQYGELSGTDGVGGLLRATEQLSKLDVKLQQMQDFGKGLQIHVLDVGNLINDRLDHVAGKDLEMGSRRDSLVASSKLLENNDRLLRQLENEVGAGQSASR